jgi:hypothetical protein
MTDDSIIQRAFGLAASGSFQTVAELEKALKREGFTQVNDIFAGRHFARSSRSSWRSRPALTQEGDFPVRAAARTAPEKTLKPKNTNTQPTSGGHLLPAERETVRYTGIAQWPALTRRDHHAHMFGACHAFSPEKP